MSKEKQKQICNCWDRHESADPNASTEQLLARVSADCKVDDSDVAEALYVQNHFILKAHLKKS